MKLNGESGHGVDDDRTMVPEFEEDDRLSAFEFRSTPDSAMSACALLMIACLKLALESGERAPIFLGMLPRASRPSWDMSICWWITLRCIRCFCIRCMSYYFPFVNFTRGRKPTDLEHIQKSFFLEWLRENVIHSGGGVSHDFVRFRVTRHRDDRCTLVKLANKIRRRYTIQFGHDDVLFRKKKNSQQSIPLINQRKTAK